METLTMRRRSLCVIFLAALMTAAACRQADGELPAREGEVPNRLADIRKDLLAIASGDRGAASDLGDDLSVFAESPGNAAARALAQRVADAVATSRLSEESAGQLADQLWIAVAGRQLSERQVQALQEDVRELLTSAGADEQHIDAAVRQIAEVQQSVTARSRRWYERF
jgi:hypothetical protein